MHPHYGLRRTCPDAGAVREGRCEKAFSNQRPALQDQHIGGDQGVGRGVSDDGVVHPAAARQRPSVVHARHRPGQPAAVQGAEEDRGHQEGRPGEPGGGQVIG